MLEAHQFRTTARQELVNVTEAVQEIVTNSGIQQGVCYVYCPHTTAGLTINSYMDPMTPKDIVSEIDRLIPTRLDFHHIVDTPSDAAGHIKSVLLGVHQVVIVHDGQLVLGHSQGILFAEFDGPRNRQVYVKIMGDA